MTIGHHFQEAGVLVSASGLTSINVGTSAFLMVDSAGIVLIISSVTVSVVTIIGAIFAGWLALKQIPAVSRKTEAVAIKAEEIAVKTDGNYSKLEARMAHQDELIMELRAAAIEKSDQALEKSEAREAPRA